LIKHSIRRKLISVFVITSSIVFLANMYMYMNVSKSLNKIDEVYISNIELNELLEAVTDVHHYLYDYLNTKSTEALENYYRSEYIYSSLIYKLNTDIIDDDMIIKQKNIKNMSNTYLETSKRAVDAKRGRNIKKYKENYEDANMTYEYIRTYITGLNTEQFKNNSNNYELLLSSLRYLELISAVVLIVITTFNIALIIILTRSMTGSLLKLTKAANEISAGNFEVDYVEVESSDEVGIVTKAFNTMIVNIHEYINKIKENMEKELLMTNHLKDAQLRYLQAQINPHFLFNTLNAGAQLAMMEGADNTTIYIEKMADFFRFNMKSFEYDSTIVEEIELVDNYIYILNVRYVGEIHFKKDIIEGVHNVKVPSMILQPVVENAINYGIRDIDYEGWIHLSVYEDEKHINISIKDNGVGMDQDTINSIIKAEIKSVEDQSANYSKKGVVDDSNGIGLKNVINRLKLYYEKNDVFEIISEGQYKGTEVIIHIPKMNI